MTFDGTSATIFYWTNMMFTIGLGIIINIFRSARKFPFNIIFYIVFSFCIGLLLGALIATNLRAHKQGFIIILYLFCMTIGTFACIIIFTFKKWILDKSNCILSQQYLDILVLIFLVMVFLLQLIFNKVKLIIYQYIVNIYNQLNWNYFCFYNESFFRSVNRRGNLPCNLQFSYVFLLKKNEFIGGALLFYIDITVFIIYLSFTAVITLIVSFIIALCQACAHIN
ncbi:unnamed protein product [Paramecium pentaurelia]|uniref:Uncharacterized protein n=1 Tax=Paramecium pentaurelia TaxID=43138 RepID=A0A8S1XZD6_9CILI|nr:unnamed protein product [Paramecium pentaurelia]